MINIRALFLDVDGVLNYRGCKYKLPNSNIYFVDDEKIKLLKQILDATDAQVVLSSTWRYELIWSELGMQTDGSFDLLRSKLLEYDIKLISRTPKLESGYRGEEIDTWLKSWRGDKVESFVILDDDTDMLDSQKDNFVNTDAFVGLTWHDAEKAIEILNKNDDL